jgi:hypothetical protein
MKAVYTLWSRPKPFKLFDAERWALSTHHARRLFGSISIVTDSPGASRLEELGIEFDQVDLSLDSVEGISPDFWAAGKVVTYSLQQDPFFHLDDDVFLFGHLPDRILGADLFAQSPEVEGKELEYYRGSVSAFSAEDLDGFVAPIDEWAAYNAGIFGGQDVEFFHRYSKKALEWARRMTAEGKAHPKGMTLMEQASFAYMARQEGRHVECLLTGRSDPRAKEYQYTHLIDAKYNTAFQKRVADRLKKDCPGVYTKIRRAYGVAV